jgi:hypothetical protein
MVQLSLVVLLPTESEFPFFLSFIVFYLCFALNQGCKIGSFWLVKLCD